MISLPILDDQIDRASKLYSFDQLNGSITKGKSNMYGAIGEIVVFDFFKKKEPVDFDSCHDYDMTINGYKVDVKTKRTTVVPKPEYYCSVSSWNTSQKCDYYFFCRVKEDFSMAYLLGYSSKEDFYSKAEFKKKGESDVNGFLFKDDCYNLEISKLNKFKTN